MRSALTAYGHRFRTNRVSVASAVLLAVLGSTARGLGTMQTTTTIYLYNADHALTAATTTVDGQSSTVYFTWDDCLPSTGNPASCTVSAGNGNLLGFGSAPGSGYTTQFAFDQRNRLTSAAASGAQSVAYTYHPASLMATATLGSGDALAFTYDVSPLPQVTNLRQASTGTWASYLGDTTYLSNGTEQALCQPRKDVAGVYSAAAETFTPLRYDPYGAIESASTVTSSPATGATSYDLTQNPFRYAGEYTDPAWGGSYLRARWYLAKYQTLLSRDPNDPVHRYGYAGGNAIGNIDPSGLNYGSFSRATEKAFSALTDTGRGPWWHRIGFVVPLVPVLGQVVGGATLLATLPQLWHHGTEATWLNFGILAASAALEGTGAFRSFDAELGTRGAFALRHGIDAAVGAGQTAIVQAVTNRGKVDTAAVIQSAEYSVGAIVSAREGAGIGYRPHYLSAENVDALIAEHFESGQTRPLVFEVRTHRLWESPLGREREPEMAFIATSKATAHATSMQVQGDDDDGNIYNLYVDHMIRGDRTATNMIANLPNEVEFQLVDSSLRKRNLNTWLGTFPQQSEFDGLTQKSKLVIYTNGTNVVHTSAAEYVDSIVNNQIGLIGKGGRRQTGY